MFEAYFSKLFSAHKVDSTVDFKIIWISYAITILNLKKSLILYNTLILMGTVI